MIGVTNNSPQQINAALIAMKNEVKKEVTEITNTKIEQIESDTIDDTTISPDYTWSSQKISGELETLTRFPTYLSSTSIYSYNNYDTAVTRTDTDTVNITQDGWYRFQAILTNVSGGVVTNSVDFLVNGTVILNVFERSTAGWTDNSNTVIIPIRAGSIVSVEYNIPAGFQKRIGIWRLGD